VSEKIPHEEENTANTSLSSEEIITLDITIISTSDDLAQEAKKPNKEMCK